ncbi:MAG: HD domain-containing protein [Planctomycetota bacterium]|nr:HD domain-containing protein [Planctomycetota bacterium]
MPLLDALLALQPLHDLPRTGWILRGIKDPESVGDHVLSTAFLVLTLGPRVDPAIDVERALAMAVLHDVPEALTGDLPRSASELLPKGVKHAAEDLAASRLIAPLSGLALERWQEYRAQSTREARFARTCDRLQLGLRLVAYVRAGHRGLDEFRTTVAEVDCTEFPAATAFKSEILAAL